MTNFHYHLLEIQYRIYYLLFSTVSLFTLCCFYQYQLVYFVGRPFLKVHQTFIFLELTEALYTYIQISCLVTVLCLLPLIVYHLWCFLLPSCYQNKRKGIHMAVFFYICSWMFTLSSLYFIVLPQICQFLVGFEIPSAPFTLSLDKEVGPLVADPPEMTAQQKNSVFLEHKNNSTTVCGEVATPLASKNHLLCVEFHARIYSYVSLCLDIGIVALLGVHLVLCAFFFSSQKKVFAYFLSLNRKISCVIGLLLSAFIVPPDISSQLLLFLVFFCIFEICIFIGIMWHHRHLRKTLV